MLLMFAASFCLSHASNMICQRISVNWCMTDCVTADESKINWCVSVCCRKSRCRLRLGIANKKIGRMKRNIRIKYNYDTNEKQKKKKYSLKSKHDEEEWVCRTRSYYSIFDENNNDRVWVSKCVSVASECQNEIKKSFHCNRDTLKEIDRPTDHTSCGDFLFHFFLYSLKELAWSASRMCNGINHLLIVMLYAVAAAAVVNKTCTIILSSYDCVNMFMPNAHVLFHVRAWWAVSGWVKRLAMRNYYVNIPRRSYEIEMYYWIAWNWANVVFGPIKWMCYVEMVAT